MSHTSFAVGSNTYAHGRPPVVWYLIVVRNIKWDKAVTAQFDPKWVLLDLTHEIRFLGQRKPKCGNLEFATHAHTRTLPHQTQGTPVLLVPEARADECAHDAGGGSTSLVCGVDRWNEQRPTGTEDRQASGWMAARSPEGSWAAVGGGVTVGHVVADVLGLEVPTLADGAGETDDTDGTCAGGDRLLFARVEAKEEEEDEAASRLLLVFFHVSACRSCLSFSTTVSTGAWSGRTSPGLNCGGGDFWRGTPRMARAGFLHFGFACR